MKSGSVFRWSEVTAIFGGAFDPPHWGHIHAVAGLFSCPGVKRAVMMPTADPVQKKPLVSAHHRIEMARIAVSSMPPYASSNIAVSTWEIERSALSKRPNYTIESAQLLQSEWGEQIAWVIGADQLNNLSSWHRFPELLGACHWIVLERKPEKGSDSSLITGLQKLQEAGLLRSTTGVEKSALVSRTNTKAHQGNGIHAGYHTVFGTYLIVVHTDAPPISSTTIRESLARGMIPGPDQIPGAVAHYLLHNRLYGTDEG